MCCQTGVAVYKPCSLREVFHHTSRSSFPFPWCSLVPLPQMCFSSGNTAFPPLQAGKGASTGPSGKQQVSWHCPAAPCLCPARRASRPPHRGLPTCRASQAGCPWLWDWQQEQLSRRCPLELEGEAERGATGKATIEVPCPPRGPPRCWW